MAHEVKNKTASNNNNNNNNNKSIFLTQYCSGDQIEKNQMGGAYSRYGGHEILYGVLVGKPEGKRSLGRHRSRWKDNKKNGLQEVG